MKISILGPLRVSVGDTHLTYQDFGGTKPRELLALLLLARGRPITKQALAERLWTKKQPKNVGGTLETYVSVLRRQLFPDRQTARQVLSTSAGAYSFATNSVELDIDVFDRLVNRADIAGSDHVALLTEATELARGDLLEDIGDLPWLAAERELYRDRATRAFVMLGDAHLAHAAWPAALEAAEAALRIRPFSEEAVRTTMLAYHAMGHDDAARLAFDRCRAMLGEELGADPISETEDLAGAISAGVPAAELLEERGIVVTPQPAPTLGAVDRRSPDRRLPFLGRTAELERIRTHVEASRAGSFRIVGVRGSRGIGKTALLDELGELDLGPIGRQSFTVSDRERPRLPLEAALRDLLADGPALAEAEAYAQAPFIGYDSGALDQLGTLLRRHSPMVLLLDDLHWADLATITAIAWLHREAPSLPVTIVATERLRLRQPSRLLDLVPSADPIRLGALGREVVQRGLVKDELLEVTGGLPTLLADTVRWVSAGGQGPSPSIRNEVFRSVRGLAGPHRSVLQALACVRAEADAFELSRLGVLSPAETVTALEELVELDIVEVTDSQYRFRAPMVRDILARTLSRSSETDDADGSHHHRGGMANI